MAPSGPLKSCPGTTKRQLPASESTEAGPHAAPDPFHYTPYLGQDELLHRLVPQLVHLHTTAWRTETSHEEGLLQIGGEWGTRNRGEKKTKRKT